MDLPSFLLGNHAEVTGIYHLELCKNPPSLGRVKESHMIDQVTTHQAEEDSRNETVLIYVDGQIVVLSQILAIVGLRVFVGHTYPARAANCLNGH